MAGNSSTFFLAACHAFFLEGMTTRPPTLSVCCMIAFVRAHASSFGLTLRLEPVRKITTEGLLLWWCLMSVNTIPGPSPFSKAGDSQVS